MPTYEYRCERGHVFEAEQSVLDPPLKTCMVDKHAGSNCCAIGTCNAPCKRLISESSFILKGTGWAKDGYGNGTQRKNKRTPKSS